MITIDGKQYHGPMPCGDLVSERNPCPPGYKVHPRKPIRYVPIDERAHTFTVNSRRKGCRTCRGL